MWSMNKNADRIERSGKGAASSDNLQVEHFWDEEEEGPKNRARMIGGKKAPTGGVSNKDILVPRLENGDEVELHNVVLVSDFG